MNPAKCKETDDIEFIIATPRQLTEGVIRKVGLCLRASLHIESRGCYKGISRIQAKPVIISNLKNIRASYRD